MIEPENASVVLTAGVFNPSIFSQVWLVDHNLVAKEEFAGQSITSPNLSQHVLGNVGLFVIPPKLEVGYPSDDLSAAEKACRIVTRVAELLPHTPYKAMGINFRYALVPEGPNFGGFLRRLFACPNSPLAALFGQDDAKFGGYFSKDTLDGRLKLDAKPVRQQDQPDMPEKIMFSFNIHIGLEEREESTRPAFVKKCLGNWEKYHETVREIVQAAAAAEEHDQGAC